MSRVVTETGRDVASAPRMQARRYALSRYKAYRNATVECQFAERVSALGRSKFPTSTKCHPSGKAPEKTANNEDHHGRNLSNGGAGSRQCRFTRAGRPQKRSTDENSTVYVVAG